MVAVLPLPVIPFQRLEPQSVLHAGRQGLDGPRLIAGGTEKRLNEELIQLDPLSRSAVVELL